LILQFYFYDSANAEQLPSLEQHIEENAMTNARFADVTIHLANFPPIPAHAIFLARSPYLHALLNNQPPSPPYTINLPTSDPNLTLDALRTTLHLLYTPTPLPRTPPPPNTIISHIAAACALGIYPAPLVDLYRSILLQQNLHPSTILQFTTFLLSAPHPITPATAHPGPYPPFTTGLLANVISYFLTTLPLHLSSSLPAALPASAASEDYKAMLVPLPFDIMKLLLEHPSLPISGEKARYELAKQVVAKRAAREKQLRRRSEEKGQVLGPVMEESVILKVGGKDGGGVQVVRSLGRRRGLWKAASSGNVGEGRRSRNSTAGSK
jgi:BTB/POZ domain